MPAMWVVTRETIPHVAKQTGYTEVELTQIFDAYTKHGQTTVSVSKKPKDLGKNNETFVKIEVE